ncbi:unnamed protein product [Ambrosiozyma monospora]|uniref:Unnamed protein product n=1 Tax=Ambrosiozyma monospora TaxID=43982 RepID=A0A9W6Z4G7_AMBMO|nr:unnamed protein product [Ambrosiozyma monospora]
MSGKRIKSQLTRENYEGSGRDSDEEYVAPTMASKEKMATRKIAGYKPKFGAKKASDSAPSTTGLFGFLNKPSTTPPSSKSPSNGQTASNGLSVIDQALQLKSLNANFLQAINNAITKNPVADLTPILKKYSDYYEKVQSNKIQVSQPIVPLVPVKPHDSSNDKFKGNFSFNPTATAASSTSAAPTFTPSPAPAVTPVFNQPATIVTEKRSEENKVVPETKPAQDSDVIEVDSESEDESDDEVKIEGPKFEVKALPKSKDYGFKFGYVPPPDSDSDSEDEVKIEGPKFSLGTNVQIKDAVFKFPPKADKKDEQKDEKKDESKPASGFAFKPTESANKPASTPAPVFNFTASKAAEEQKPR